MRGSIDQPNSGGPSPLSPDVRRVACEPVTLRRTKFLVPVGKVYFTSVAERNVTVNAGYRCGFVDLDTQ